MASGCPASSSHTQARGCCGPNGRTTGATLRCRRNGRSSRWRVPFRASSRVTVGVSRAFFESARILLPEHIRVVEMSHDDCWARDVAPTFVVDEAGDVRGVHWRFNAWGGLQGGLYSPWDQDELVARKILEIEASRSLPARHHQRRRRHPRGRRRHRARHRRVPAEPEQKPRSHARADRSEAARLSRRDHHCLARARASSTTRPTGTSTISPASRVPAKCASPGPTTSAILSTPFRSMPGSASTMRATRAAVASRCTSCRAPARSTCPRRKRKGSSHARARRSGLPGDRLAGSYVNFYIANGGIVMPLLDARTDRAAAAILRKVFRKATSGGRAGTRSAAGRRNIHCITQQVPAAGVHKKETCEVSRAQETADW